MTRLGVSIATTLEATGILNTITWLTCSVVQTISRGSVNAVDKTDLSLNTLSLLLHIIACCALLRHKFENSPII